MGQILVIIVAAGMIYLICSVMVRMFRGALHPHGHHHHREPPRPPGGEEGGP